MPPLPSRLTELQAMIQQGSVDPATALRYQSDQLRALDEKFHAVVKTFPPNSHLKGSLFGIGLAHKDLFNLPGREPGFGHHSGVKNLTTTTAAVISKLDGAGASQLAALVMAPYACGATSQNPNFPRCINPLNESYAVGGSSSGSAVAVASKMSYVSLGSDTTGSVRIPSATCGITGLKTTAGLISLQGVSPLSTSLDSIGILGRYAKDIEVVLDIIANQHLDASIESPHFSSWLPKQRIDPLVSLSIEQFLQNLASIIAIELTEFDDLCDATNTMMAHEISTQYAKEIASENPPKGLKSVGKIAQLISLAQYEQVIHSRQQQSESFIEKYLSTSDILLIPCLGQSLPNWEAVEIGNPNFSREAYLSLFQFMGFINLLGLPSISFPIGEDSRGRPVSIQAIARPFQEKTLLNFAHQMEQQLFDGNCYIDQFHPDRS